MTQAHWEARFEQLMSENLIDVPKDFYKDDLPFNDPDKLNNIFTELEEENLFKIHSMAEKEQMLEKIKQEELQLHYNLEKNHIIHLKNKTDLEFKISEADQSLNMMKNRKRGGPATNNTNDTKITPDEMLYSIGEKVKAVYKDLGSSSDVLLSKDTLAILNVSNIYKLIHCSGLGNEKSRIYCSN